MTARTRSPRGHIWLLGLSKKYGINERQTDLGGVLVVTTSVESVTLS